MPQPFTWQDFLDLADQLQSGSDPSDAALRTSVSRAYYALFCIARDFAIQKGLLITETADDHYKVKEFFSIGKRSGVGQILDDLRRWRNQCDYDVSPRNFRKMATDSIQRATRAIEMIKN